MDQSKSDTTVMIDRRLALVVTLALLALPLVGDAQPAGAVRTIGLLGSQTDGYRVFKDRLRELGWLTIPQSLLQRADHVIE